MSRRFVALSVPKLEDVRQVVEPPAFLGVEGRPVPGHRPGKNWPSLEAVRPVPQKADIGSAAWASTTTANARSNASPSTCQRAMRISSQNPCVLVASAILRRPRLMPSASSTLSRPMRSRQGSPGSQVREGLGEPGGVVHLEEDVRDARLGHPPVEVGDRVGGPVRHGGFRPLDAEHAVFDAAAGVDIAPAAAAELVPCPRTEASRRSGTGAAATDRGVEPDVLPTAGGSGLAGPDEDVHAAGTGRPEHAQQIAGARIVI